MVKVRKTRPKEWLVEKLKDYVFRFDQSFKGFKLVCGSNGLWSMERLDGNQLNQFTNEDLTHIIDFFIEAVTKRDIELELSD